MRLKLAKKLVSSFFLLLLFICLFSKLIFRRLFGLWDIKHMWLILRLAWGRLGIREIWQSLIFLSFQVKLNYCPQYITRRRSQWLPCFQGKEINLIANSENFSLQFNQHISSLKASEEASYFIKYICFDPYKNQ